MTTDSQISDREREILQLVASGATNQQIAQELNISVNTVKVHLRNIFAKIGVVSRTEATLYAVRNGLIQVHESPVAPGEATGVEEEQADAPEASTQGTEQSAPAQEGATPDETPSPQVTGIVRVTPDIETEPPPVDTMTHPTAVAVPQLPARRDRRWLLAGGLVVLLLAAVAVMLVPTLGTERQLAADSAEVDLPELDQRWRELAPMPSALAEFALTDYRLDGRSLLYIIGGEASNNTVTDQVVRYDLDANVWVPFSAKPTAVSSVQAAVIGNRIYVPGGRLASGESTDVFEAYDPQRDRWTSLAPLPAPRSGYMLAALEGKLYLFGGWDGQAYRGEVWQYSPDEDVWSEQTPMPTARAFGGAAAIGGQIYIIGGENATGRLNVNESYTPADDTGADRPWSVKAPIPAPRSKMATAAINALIFVLSGAETEGSSLLYNSSTDQWQTIATPLSATIQGLRARAVGNNLYIFGGRDAEYLQTKTYEYQAVYSVVLPLGPGQ